MNKPAIQYLKLRPGTPFRDMPSENGGIWGTAGDNPKPLRVYEIVGGYAAISLDGKRLHWVPLSAGELSDGPRPAMPAIFRDLAGDFAQRDPALRQHLWGDETPPPPLNTAGLDLVQRTTVEAMYSRDPEKAALLAEQYRQTADGQKRLAWEQAATDRRAATLQADLDDRAQRKPAKPSALIDSVVDDITKGR